MTEGNDRPSTPGSFKEHKLYAEAMEQLAAGDGDAAVARLRQLAEIYPEDEQLRELLLRTEFQAAVASTAAVPAEHRAPSPLLRNLLLFLLLTAIGMAMIAGLITVYNYLSGRVEAQEREQEVSSQRLEIEDCLDLGDWGCALDKIEEYRALVPDDPRIDEWHQRIRTGLALAERYVSALEAKDAGRWTECYDQFSTLQQEQPAYRPDQVAQHIEDCEDQLALEAAWLDAEQMVQAQDWPAALDRLAWIRKYHPEYRSDDVEQRLYEIYRLLGMQEIAQAGGDVTRLRQARDYLEQALRLRPTDRELQTELDLAKQYVAGAEAVDRQDWVGAIRYWEPVHQTRPGYPDGRLGEKLRELYPQAARQLISQVAGRPPTPVPAPAGTDQPPQQSLVQTDAPLELALEYLDRAVADRPDDEGLKAERDRLSAYLDGKEAFRTQYWDLAIAYWGPVYAQQPGYLDGTLREELTVACANSDDPDPTYCPP